MLLLRGKVRIMTFIPARNGRKKEREKMQDLVYALALSAQGTLLSIINQRIIFYDY